MHRVVAGFGLPLLLLGGAELLLRLVGFDRPVTQHRLTFVNPDRLWAETREDSMTVTDPWLFWRLRPGWRDRWGVPLNSAGYRTPEFETRRRPGWRRIVCLGDSVTFGVAVPVLRTWPRLLEEELRRRWETDAVEVINLGVPGYSAIQGRRILESQVVDLRPDLVILGFGAFNDWVPAIGRTDREQAHVPALHRLRVLQAVAALVPRKELDPPENPREAYDRIRRMHTADLKGPRRVPLEDFEWALEDMATRATQAGAQVIFLVPALPGETRVRNPASEDYRAAILRVAATGGHAAVDARELFSGLPDAAVFLDFCHPTEVGHARLSAGIAAVVR